MGRHLKLAGLTVYAGVTGWTFAYLAVAAGPLVGPAFTDLCWTLVGLALLMPFTGGPHGRRSLPVLPRRHDAPPAGGPGGLPRLPASRAGAPRRLPRVCRPGLHRP